MPKRNNKSKQLSQIIPRTNPVEHAVWHFFGSLFTAPSVQFQVTVVAVLTRPEVVWWACQSECTVFMNLSEVYGRRGGEL